MAASLPPELAPLHEDDPRSIGPYRVAGRLGAGGMGAVFGALALDGRCVAVKVVHDRFAAEPEYRERFTREVELVRGIEAQCAPRFLDADPAAQRPWLATEFVPGRTVSAHVRALGPLQGDALALFAAGTAEALAAVHAAGVLHRDIKPGNVMLSPQGPRVLDFGIARAMADTAPEHGVHGTPGYLAPERLDGEDSTAGDVFAWGATVVFAATGRGAFGGGSSAQVMARLRAGEHDLTGLPEGLAALVARALAQDPARRPSAEECYRQALALALPDAPPPVAEAGRQRREQLRRALGAAWRGFDAAGHDPRVWAALAGAGAQAGLTLLGAGAAGPSSAVGAASAQGAAAGAALSGGKVMAGAAAVVGVAAAAGAVAVFSTGGEETAPVAEAAPPEEEEEDALPFAAQEVGYRGLTLHVPEDWGAYHREEVFEAPGQPEPPQSDEWMVLVPEPGPGCDEDAEWEWSAPRSSHASPGIDGTCPHIKILGPEAIALGFGASGPGYHPGSQIEPCPDDVALIELEPEELDGGPPRDTESGEVAIAGRQAAYHEVWFPCADYRDYQETGAFGYAAYYQHTYFLAEAEILVVDRWGDPEFAELLEFAE